MGNCEAMTSSTRSFAYSYQLVKKCSLKICETSKCHNFFIFQPIFIRFLLFYWQIFTLSYEFKLNLFRSSPLISEIKVTRSHTIEWSRYGYLVDSLWGVYIVHVMSNIIKGKLNWMYRCNKVTEKHLLFVSFNSNIERWGVLVLMNATNFPCAVALLARSRWHADFHDIGLLSVACQSVGLHNHSVRNIYKMQMHCIADITKWPIR